MRVIDTIPLWLVGVVAAFEAQAQTFAWPVNGPSIGQQYAAYGLVSSGEYHTGIDMRSSTGDTRVLAAAGGTARVVPLTTYTGGMGENYGMGNVVVVDHGNRLFSLYAHLATILVRTGDRVSTRQQIGTYGTTGCRLAAGGCSAHLHFELRLWNQLGNLDDDLGPEWGYTPAHPNLSGYVNPYPYLEYTISSLTPRAVTASTAQMVRTGPNTDYTSEVTRVEAGMRLFALAEHAGWYQVYLPSSSGPATGWIQAATATARRAEVTDPQRGLSGVNVRASAGTTATVRAKVWDDQVLAVLNEGAAGNGCAVKWYQVPLAANGGNGAGWVCGTYLAVDPATPIEEPEPVPLLKFHGAAPNPASGPTLLRFDLSVPARVSLTAYDVLGHAIAVMPERSMEPGPHRVPWEPAGLPRGPYWIVLQAGAERRTASVVLL